MGAGPGAGGHDRRCADPLNALLDAQISGSSPFAVTITILPAGSVVAGMMQTTIGGQTVWTAQGRRGNASLQALLAGIAITPPPNWNDNQGPFSFSTTLTTYDQGGGRNDASLTLTPPVTAVSDAIDLVTSAVAAEDAAASISLTLANPEDGAASQVIGGKVYVSVNESGMTANGGVLSVGGVPLATETNPPACRPEPTTSSPVSAAQRRSPCSIRAPPMPAGPWPTPLTCWARRTTPPT